MVLDRNVWDLGTGTEEAAKFVICTASLAG